MQNFTARAPLGRPRRGAAPSAASGEVAPLGRAEVFLLGGWELLLYWYVFLGKCYIPGMFFLGNATFLFCFLGKCYIPRLENTAFPRKTHSAEAAILLLRNSTILLCFLGKSYISAMFLGNAEHFST